MTGLPGFEAANYVKTIDNQKTPPLWTENLNIKTPPP